MKLWTTEAGFRVAGIARWPGVIDSGQEIGTPVSSLDLLPTFCELAGASIPADFSHDGVSIVGSGFGAEKIERPKPLIWCYYNAINERRVAMRHGDWKVLASLNGGKLPKYSNVHPGNAEEVQGAELTDIQIFRVTEDISEEQDLAGAYPEELKRLTGVLKSAYTELLADSPVWTREE